MAKTSKIAADRRRRETVARYAEQQPYDPDEPF